MSFIALDDGLERTRVEGLKIIRATAMKTLYGALSSPTTSTVPDPKSDALRSLANTFSRYAQTQQTAYETGTANASSSTTSNMLERQVQRALGQVLGRGVGNRDDGFGSALIDTFPTLKNGKITFVPARGSVQLSGVFGDGNAASSASAIAAGTLGQISAEQATLARQSALIVADARNVLASLKPYAPQVELDIFASVSALVANSLDRLHEEFFRIDEPRSALVEDYFRVLLGEQTGKTATGGQLAQLGRTGLLDRAVSMPATLDDEAQIAGYDLLVSYVKLLLAAWSDYDANKGAATLGFPNFSQRLARASTLLNVIAQGNANFMAAMDAVGFSETERRSSAVRFSDLTDLSSVDGLPTFSTVPPAIIGAAPPPAVLPLDMPDLTVYDLTDWIDRLVSLEGPRNLADSGQFGLTFVTLQADTLFWQILPVLAYTRSSSIELNASSVLVQVLTHERVSWALDDLLTQINALANLG